MLKSIKSFALGVFGIILAIIALVIGKVGYQFFSELLDYKTLPSEEYSAKASGLPKSFFTQEEWQVANIAGRLELQLPCLLQGLVLDSRSPQQGIESHSEYWCSAGGVQVVVGRSHATRSDLAFPVQAAAAQNAKKSIKEFSIDPPVTSGTVEQRGTFNTSLASAFSVRSIKVWGRSVFVKYLSESLAMSDGPNLYTITVLYEDRDRSRAVAERIFRSLRETQPKRSPPRASAKKKIDRQLYASPIETGQNLEELRDSCKPPECIVNYPY